MPRTPLLVADSVSRAGDRISTLLIVVTTPELTELGQMPGLACTCDGENSPVDDTARTALLTAADFTAARSLPGLHGIADGILTTIAEHEPEQVSDTGLHAPFIGEYERNFIDLSLQGLLSSARCHMLGRGRDIYTQVELYQQLLGAPEHERGALRHPALPVGHVAFAGKTLPDTLIPGWISWAEMLIRRGGDS